MRISNRSHMRPNCVVDAFPVTARVRSAAAYRRSSNRYTTLAAPHTCRSSFAALLPLPRSFPALPVGSTSSWWHHPPYSSDIRAVPAPQTTHGNCHRAAPSRQSAVAVPGASDALSGDASGSTTPPPASSVATSLRPLPAHPHPLNVPLPASVRTAPAPFPNISPQSAATPSAGISLALLGSNFFQRCGAAALWLLLRDIAATASSPADSSTPASSPRRPASAYCSSLAPEPLLVEALSCSSLSSSTGPPQEVAV